MAVVRNHNTKNNNSNSNYLCGGGEVQDAYFPIVNSKKRFTEDQGIMVVSRAPKRVKISNNNINDWVPFSSFGIKSPGVYAGAFRSNISSFLQSHADGPITLRPGVLKWRIRLRLGAESLHEDPGFVTLYVFEERVKKSHSPFCDYCKVVAGWHTNPVCKRKYHFIIPADDWSSHSSVGLGFDYWPETCILCCSYAGSPDSSRCKVCCSKLPRELDTEPEDTVFEDPKHLLHGIIHANGYGHLLRVNGREGGSRLVSGCDIMDLWDRTCIMLRARKVSVMDVSKKYGLEYRLLHAVQKGYPWYSNWGYLFAKGSFGISHGSYKEALDRLSNFPLAAIMSDANIKYDKCLIQIISFYRFVSPKDIMTLRDLVCYIMELLHQCPLSGKALDHALSTSKSHVSQAKWDKNDLESTLSALIKILKTADCYKWLSWQDLKGAVCHGRNPDLVEYGLKQLYGKSIEDNVILGRCVPTKKTLEFRFSTGTGMDYNSMDNSSNILTREAVLGDLKTIYYSLLHPLQFSMYGRYGVSKQCADFAQRILDCKQFIKNYEDNEFISAAEDVVKVSVKAEILNDPLAPLTIPPELLVLANIATVADLKQYAEAAFKDVYLSFKNFQLERIVELGADKDSMNLIFLLGTEGTLTIQGHVKGDISKYRAERGQQLWVVDCLCGTKDDDGERMIACDHCELWQHTRCVGITDSEDDPDEFLCRKCIDRASDTGLDSDHHESDQSLFSNHSMPHNIYV